MNKLANLKTRKGGLGKNEHRAGLTTYKGNCHTLILDLKILVQISLLFSDAFQFTMFYSAIFYCGLTAYFTVSVSKFLAFKTIQGVFLHYKPFKKISKIIAYFPAFYPIIFCIKSHKRVFWSFPTKEPILVPTTCPWVFSTCLHKSSINLCPKVVFILHLSQPESVRVVFSP